MIGYFQNGKAEDIWTKQCYNGEEYEIEFKNGLEVSSEKKEKEEAMYNNSCNRKKKIELKDLLKINRINKIEKLKSYNYKLKEMRRSHTVK